MAKYALIVGINDYSVQSQHDRNAYNLQWPSLSYCTNDADSMYHLLTQAFGFNRQDVILLKNANATRRNILSSLAYLFSNAQIGDVICFYYSGHGGLLPATNRSDNTVFYEAIIPYQGDWIYDFRLDELARAANLDPEAVNLTIIMDSCHSGGMLSAGALDQTRKSVSFRQDVRDVIQHMQVWWPFGMCLPTHNELFPENISNVRIGGNQEIDFDPDPNKTLLNSAKATLIAACKYYETAAESSQYRHGYLTQAFLDLVTSASPEITYSELMDGLASRVSRYSAGEQNPELRGHPGRSTESFLAPWTTCVADAE